MSLNKQIGEMIKTKLNLIKLQNVELHNLMNRFVDKESKDAEKTLRANGQNADDLKKVNLKLESVLNLLFITCETFDRHLENVLLPDMQTSPTEKTTLPNIATAVANELNRRLDSLELSSSSQIERINTLELANDQQKKKLNALEEQVIILKDALKTSETRHLIEMKASKLQRDDMEDNLVSQMRSLKNLQELVEGNDKIYFDTLVSSKDFSEVLLWRSDAEKRLEKLVTTTESLEQLVTTTESLEQLGTTTEALEYDVKNVMDWHKELEKEVKHISPKLKEVETRVQWCSEILHSEKQSLHSLQERLTEAEVSRREELCHLEKTLKEPLDKSNRALENVNTSFNLICQLIANKLLPLRRLQETLCNTQNEFHMKRREFETKVTQFMTSSEAELTSVKSKMKELAGEVVNKTSAQVYLKTGFTVFLKGYYNFKEDDIVSPYRDTDLAVFDPDTGVFTAPCEGLYLSFMTLSQKGDGQVRAHVCRLPGFLNSNTKLVCKGRTNRDEGSCCGAGCIRLNAGDRLGLRIISMDDDVKLTPYTSFTCCLVALI